MTATPGERIGGWLIAPLAWLLVALLSASLALLLYTTALITPHAIQTLMSQSVLNIAMWFVSFVFAIAMWYYTLWLTIAFFKRRKSVPKHYIIWLLISVLLAVKAFAFSPVSDALAVRQLLFPLLAAGGCAAGALLQAFDAGKKNLRQPVITLQLTCCRLLWFIR
ncbi:hypothetical protein WP5S18E01_25040 [Enterobacter cloacae]|nr:hypothetical protein WP5S18E01_25040 [Enterobacter cloacae]